MVFHFLYYAEYLVVGSTFLFREGRAKGIGKVGGMGLLVCSKQSRSTKQNYQGQPLPVSNITLTLHISLPKSSNPPKVVRLLHSQGTPATAVQAHPLMAAGAGAGEGEQQQQLQAPPQPQEQQPLQQQTN